MSVVRFQRKASGHTSEIDATSALPYFPKSGIVGGFRRLDFPEGLNKVHQWRHSSALDAPQGLGSVGVGDGSVEDRQRRERGSSCELFGGERSGMKAEALGSGEIKEVYSPMSALASAWGQRGELYGEKDELLETAVRLE